MGWLKQIFSRSRRYDEIAESIREHLEEKIEDLMEDGLSREEATGKAHREFGNVTLIEERSREVWQWPRLETLFQDLRFGVRMLLKHKSFTAVAILSLALGIGANTAIFTLINATLLKALPVTDPHQLVVFTTVGPQGTDNSYSYRQIEQFNQNNHSFTGIITASGLGRMRMTEPGGQVESVQATRVSGNFFSVLGVNAVAGRTLTADDDQAPSPLPVAV